MNKNIKELLLQVERPSRYVGGEYNMPDMDKPYKARVCMCFPDVYEIGMSNIGLRILYHMLNDTENIVCERCFTPALDMAKMLIENDSKLFSVETQRLLTEFDVVGFSVGYEMLYTNILFMLDLAGIPFRASERDDSYPIIIAGGPCVINPEPFADYCDAILIGEGEINLKNFMDKYLIAKSGGVSKQDFLMSVSIEGGVYVPQYNNGRTVTKSVVKCLDDAYFPTKILVPNIEITHDRAVLELYRGCSNGCRFCQAGFYYRPIREHSLEKLLTYAGELIKYTGYDELSLASLSTSDYSRLSELISGLKGEVCGERVKLALPSLRLDGKEEFAGIGRLGSLTFAPEAGTARLRNVINKNITDENIERTMTYAIKSGYNGVKLYFMIGLPTETQEDIQGIVDIVHKIRKIASEEHRRNFSINVSTSVFIPKPCTPFQWSGQITQEEMLGKQAFLKNSLKLKNVRYSWHDATTSVIETVLARGDRRLGEVIIRAYELGAKFDGWSEHFKWDIWKKAFEDLGIGMEYYTREWSESEVLPWEFIDCGVSREYLLSEKHLAEPASTTKACGKQDCRACGANRLGRCFE